ncbi:MAG: thiol:disulfide interchange protein DsbA/DsbL [Burkholderiales bacterium]|nr:thiol:disulfide interchange protein DsbA/DsbL [Burkholderiales bacterium]
MQLSKFVAAAWLGVLALLSVHAAQAQQPVAGKEYQVLSQPRPTDTGKILVVEFFSYACPACANFEPYLQEWLKRKPADVEYRQVPMAFRDTWVPLAKTFFTLKVMGLQEKYHIRIFDAIHKQGVALDTDAQVFSWIGKQGVDVAKFKSIYASPGIDSKVGGATHMGRQYGINGTPAVGVNGRYWTSPSLVFNAGAKDIKRFFQVLDQLVAMERAKAGKPAKG